MIAYKIEIHKSKFANILFREFDLSEPGLVGYQSGTGLSKLPYCIQIYNESFCSVSWDHTKLIFVGDFTSSGRPNHEPLIRGYLTPLSEVYLQLNAPN